MKKIINLVVVFSMVIATLFCAPIPTYAAGNVSVTASKTSVNVGDTVTITISVSSGYGVQGSLSRNSGAFGGNLDSPYTVGDAAGQSNSTSFTFTATQEGSCTFSASVIESYDGELNPAGIGGGAVTVTVNNASSNAGGNGGGSSNNGSQNSGNNEGNGGETQKSGDSSLKSLVISNGALSPAFSSDNKTYTAIVDYSVTSIAVSATPNNAKAKVSSVSGNDNLEVGENTVKIVVKAENGVSSTYSITVTRRTEDDPENSDAQKKVMPSFSVNGEKRVLSENIPQESIPEDFSASNIMIKGTEYPNVSFAKGNLQLLYLTNENGEGGNFYVYDQNQDAVYPFIKLTSGSHYVILLLPNVNDIPEDYIESTLSIEGKGVFTAYQTPEMLENSSQDNQTPTEDPESPSNTEGEGVGFLNIFAPETVYADEAKTSDFYLIYCMNDKGETGWYTYDSVEETYMRYFKLADKTAPVVTESIEKKNPANILLYIIMGVMALVIAVLFGAVVLLSKAPKKKSSDDENDDNYYARIDDVENQQENFEEDRFTDKTDETTEENQEDEATENEQDGEVDQITENKSEDEVEKATEAESEDEEEKTTEAESENEEEKATATESEDEKEKVIEAEQDGKEEITEVELEAEEENAVATESKDETEDTQEADCEVEEREEFVADTEETDKTEDSDDTEEADKTEDSDETEKFDETGEATEAEQKDEAVSAIEAALESNRQNADAEEAEKTVEPIDPVLADLEAKLLEKLEQDPILANKSDEDGDEDGDLEIIDL